MKLDWITDPHLDHLAGEREIIAFVEELHARDSEGLLLTGDIAQSETLYDYLGIISGAYQRPVYFVLGNHDYYGAWMHQTRDRVQAVCEAVPEGILNWMPDAGVLMLSPETAVVGHDGMYDGQAGVPGLELGLTDFHVPHGVLDMIRALELGSRHLFELLLELGRASADHVRESVRQAVRRGARRVLVITHVPPFLESSYFRGRPSDPRSAPFYVNRSLGEALLELSSERPDVQLDVFAGHTHGARVHRAADNLVVRVGRARYGSPPVWQEPVVVRE